MCLQRELAPLPAMMTTEESCWLGSPESTLLMSSTQFTIGCKFAHMYGYCRAPSQLYGWLTDAGEASLTLLCWKAPCNLSILLGYVPHCLYWLSLPLWCHYLKMLVLSLYRMWSHMKQCKQARIWNCLPIEFVSLTVKYTRHVLVRRQCLCQYILGCHFLGVATTALCSPIQSLGRISHTTSNAFHGGSQQLGVISHC